MAITLEGSGTNETSIPANDGTITLTATQTPSIPGSNFIFSISRNGGTAVTETTTATTVTFDSLDAGSYSCGCRVGTDIAKVIYIPISTASPTPDPDPPTPPIPVPMEYRERYQGSFCDKLGNNIIITFLQNVPVASIIFPVVSIQFAGEQDGPVVVDYPDNGEYKLTPINGSQCEIRIKAEGDFELSSMYTADEKEWRVVISGAWKWTGYLIPDSCIEPFASKPYDVSVRATDALGLLKDVPFQRDDLTKYKGFYSDKEVIRLCLLKTGLSLNMLVGVNTYEALMQVGNNRSPLGQSYINVEPFLNDDGTAMDCYTVIESILRRWSARLHQFNGVWQIVNVMEKSLGNVFAYNFNPDGGHESPDVTLGNSLIAGGQNRLLKPVGNTSFAKAFKQSEAYYEYGYISNALFNGDFDTWTTKPNGLPDGWEMTGGTSGTTMIRYQDGYATSDYFIEIGNGGTGGIKPITPVQIRQYDFPTITFDLYAIESIAYGGTGRGRYISVFISNSNGFWYTADGWKQTNQAYVIKKDSGDFLKQMRIEIKVDPLEDDYLMSITILAVGLANGVHFKTSINNVNISAGFGTGREKNAIAESNLQVLLTKQSFVPDRLDISHSDDSNPTRTSGIRINSTNDFFPLVNPNDAPFSSLWKRAGITEYLPLLSTVANTELRLHQRAYRIIDFEYYGDQPLDINTLLSVDLLEGTYIFLSGSFDLKSGIPRLKFAQVLTEAVLVNETLKMDYGD